MIKLRTPSYIVLGMLRLGARSGYAIKKATDISTRVFLPISLAQIYPELARLAEAGLVTRRDDSQGRRSRSAYTATEDGEEALLAWLRSPRFAPTQFRDEGILRLFFADALPHAEQIELVARMAARAREAEGWMRDAVLPAAETLSREEGFDRPLSVARLGADVYRFIAEQLEAMEVELTKPEVAGSTPSTASRETPAGS